MTSDATTMSKPSSRGTPFGTPPRPTTISRSARSLRSTTRFQVTVRGSMSEGVALVQVVVDHRREQVVGRGDRGEVAGEGEVDVDHRHHLAVPAAGRAALDAEHRSHRRLAQRDDALLADAAQRVGQPDRGRRLALAGRRGRHRRDEHEVSVGPVLQASAGSPARPWPWCGRTGRGPRRGCRASSRARSTTGVMSAASAISMSDGNGVGASTSMLTPPIVAPRRPSDGRRFGCAAPCGGRPRRGARHGIPCSGALPRRAPPRRRRRGRRHRAPGPGRDGARRRRRHRRQGPPARPGRHRHREVAGLPRARGAARDGHRHPDGRRDRDPGAAGPDRRPRHAAPGRVARAAARPAPDLRPRQGAPQLPVRPQARGRLPRRRRRHPDVGGGGRPAGVPAGRRGGAAARLGRGHRVRRPRRAGARGVASGPGARCR